MHSNMDRLAGVAVLLSMATALLVSGVGSLTFSASYPAITSAISPHDSGLMKIEVSGGTPTGELTATCTGGSTLLPIVDTGSAGVNQPISIVQSSLPLTMAINAYGTFPSAGQGDGTMGAMFMMASNFVPYEAFAANGQFLPISEQETLFQLIGTTVSQQTPCDLALLAYLLIFTLIVPLNSMEAMDR